ncbi:glycoside hydrolase family 10 protein [Anoxynatronum buryatiense]|uniref:Uncharacterized lipoprotein YddW, UPF0748 family n=1 Tax=Anoxynatronum buryatiense TaxID=489973 RepID=A0AA45WWP3_9CLOT|nr:family 10 glycosylhydrolase [Anoxynatronum buryatiense]SMP60540.1 Uncharacterized lipoprotein YddW, UPF0748 family [Anoxynatronum buryatiense]
MLKRTGPLCFLVILFVLTTVLTAGAVAPEKTVTERPPMRGLWVASVLNIDYPSKPTTDPAVLKAEAITILETAEAAGLNAIFLQVRPTADAFYQSRYFPWSRYLTGSQGLAPQDGFDPLQFWVEESHRRGMELHAWLNPYRITRKTKDEPAHDIAALVPWHPARLYPHLVVHHTDGNLYFDPGMPQARQLIIDSALELVEMYDIDGIHFDDYFYPGTTFDDAGTYASYGAGYASVEDWRRENVNTLIRDLHQAIQTTDPEVRFGISPFGIWANKSSHPLGSETRGNQTYFSHYADPLAWIQEGTIDYIAPQIYWHIGFDIADYHTLLAWWNQAMAGSAVDLYIGQAAYRVGNSDPASPWHGIGEMDRQLQMNTWYPLVKGSIFYNYSALKRNPDLVTLLKHHFHDK